MKLESLLWQKKKKKNLTGKGEAREKALYSNESAILDMGGISVVERAYIEGVRCNNLYYILKTTKHLLFYASHLFLQICPLQ